MVFQREPPGRREDLLLARAGEEPEAEAAAGMPGKRTLTEALSGRVLRSATGGSITPFARRFLVKAAARSGTPLPEALRRRLERALRADLSRVRTHTGAEAAQAADAIAARAYAVGTDLYFADGAFDPDSADGVRLIAHEVAHTVQDPPSAGAGEQLEVSDPSEPAERQADEFADAFARGDDAEPASARRYPGSPAFAYGMAGPRRPAIHRQAKTAATSQPRAIHRADVDEILREIHSLLGGWVISDADATRVMQLLEPLHDQDLALVINQLSRDERFNLLDNLPDSLRVTSTHGRIATVIDRSSGQAYVDHQLNRSLTNPVITEDNAWRAARLIIDNPQAAWGTLGPERRALLLGSPRIRADLANHPRAMRRLFLQTPDGETKTLFDLLEIRFGVSVPPTVKPAVPSSDLRGLWQSLEQLPAGTARSGSAAAELVEAYTQPGSLDRRFHDTSDEKIPMLKSLLELRFNLRLDQDEASRGRPWDARTLRDLYAALSLVPRPHVRDNPELDSIRSGGPAEILGEYTNDKAVTLYTPPRNGARTAPPDMTLLGPRGDTFTRSVLHEIAHAVERAANFSERYCTTEAGGSWREYDLVEVATVLVEAAQADVHRWSNGNQKAMIMGELQRTLDDRRFSALRQRIFDIPGLTDTDARNVLVDPAVETLIMHHEGHAPWISFPDTGGFTVIDGRIYQESYPRKWVSYSQAARARKVSNYQFRGPREWFAEVYAVYYGNIADPSSLVVERGANQLDQVDPATKKWFDDNVDPFYAPNAQMEAETTPR